jgi:hypothetical protein
MLNPILFPLSVVFGPWTDHHDTHALNAQASFGAEVESLRPRFSLITWLFGRQMRSGTKGAGTLASTPVMLAVSAR